MPIIRALAHGESLQRRPGCCRLGVKTRGTRLRLSVCLFGTARWLTGGFAFVTLFRPFLEYLAMSNLSPKTIQKHVDNIARDLFQLVVNGFRLAHCGSRASD